jgi:hypothetical protein
VVILGLDQAPTTIGWAYGTPGALQEHGLYGPSGYGDNDLLLIRDVRKFVRRKIEQSGAKIVYFEQVIINFRGFNANVTSAQYAVQSAVMCACDDMNIDCFDVEVAKWRKRFLGRANAPKHNLSGNVNRTKDVLKDMAMIECLRRNWAPDNHHTAEAMGIWEYGCAHADKQYRGRTQLETEKRREQATRNDMVTR